MASKLIELINLEKILLLVICMSILYACSRGVRKLSNAFIHKYPLSKIPFAQTTTIILFFLHLLGSFYIIYKVINPPQELLIATLGSITFAVGLALKDLISSLISGITIMVDPPFQVGYQVTFKDVYGEVKHVGLRAVKIETLDGEIVTIPNSTFVNEAVVCALKGDINLKVSLELYASIDSDTEKIRKILNEIVITSLYANVGSPIQIVFSQVWKEDLLCYAIKLKAHVFDAHFEEDFRSDIARRSIEAFKLNGIALPHEEESPDSSLADDNEALTFAKVS